MNILTGTTLRKAFYSVLLFLVLIVLSVILNPQKSFALRSDYTFETISHWNLKQFEIGPTDIANGSVHESLVNDLSSGEGQAAGLDRLNELISNQVLGLFFDSNLDNDFEWLMEENGCTSKMKFQQGEFQLVDFQVYVEGNGCENVIKIDIEIYAEDNKNLSEIQKEKFGIVFVAVDSSNTTFVRTDGKDGEFVQSTQDPNKFLRVDEEGDGENQDYILNINLTDINLSGGPSFAISYYRDGERQDVAPLYLEFVTRESALKFDPNNPVIAAIFAQADENAVGADDETVKRDGCASTGEFSFLLCPALRMANQAIEILDDQIRKALNIDFKDYENENTGVVDDSGIKSAWASFRNIAYLLLIPLMLIIIISTALGFNFVDAYTVKRAMPRLLAAVIFIALSYDIARLMIEITNDIGAGVAGLISAPFGGSEALTLQNIFNPTGVEDALFTGILVGIGATLLIPGVIGILASYMFIVSIALLVIFSLLAIREMLLIFIIVLAPIAILTWILPGKDAMWKLWWSTFTKLLLLYPVIMGLLAVGRAFASVVPTQGGIGAVFSIMVKLTAYIGPFFFIIPVFKSLGGVMGSLAGMATNATKGIANQQKGYRAGKYKQMNADRRAGETWKGSNRLTSTLNKANRNFAMGAGSRFGMGSRGKIRDDEMATATAPEKMKTEEWRGHMFKDNTMRALTYENEEQARAGLEARNIVGEEQREALLTARRIGYSRTTQVAATQQLAMNKTGYKDAVDAERTASRVAGGNGVMEASLRENIKFTSKQVNRNDLGALSAQNPGELTDDWNARMTSEGFEGIDTFSLGREHKYSYKNMADAHVRQYQVAATAYANPAGKSTDERKQDLARVVETRIKLEETMKNAGNASGVNARVAVRLVDDISTIDDSVRAYDGDPVTGFSPVLGNKKKLQQQGQSEGAIGGSGGARTPDPSYDDARYRDGMPKDPSAGP